MPRRKKKKRKYKKRSTNNLGGLWHLLLEALPYTLCLMLLSVIIGGSYVYAMSEHLFELKDVVVLGDKPGSGANGFHFTGIKKGSNALDVKLDEVESYIRTYHPEYQSVKVRRVMPDRIEVEVAERLPIAKIQINELHWIDQDGVILNPVSEPMGVYPIIKGISISNKSLKTGDRIRSDFLTRALRVVIDIKRKTILKHHSLTAIDLSDPRNLVLELDDAIDVRMGIRNMPEKILMLEEAIISLTLNSSKIKYLDLRFDNIVVGPR